MGWSTPVTYMLNNIYLTPQTLMGSYLILRGMYKTRFDHPKGKCPYGDLG